ncbi:MAG: hypothetical protein R6W70_10075 [bacterium]
MTAKIQTGIEKTEGTKGFLELFRKIQESSLTGKMMVSCPGGFYELFFVDGAACFSEKDGIDLRNSLLSVLKENSMVSAQAIKDARKKQLNEIKNVVQILLENNEISLYSYSLTTGILLRFHTLEILSAKSQDISFEVTHVPEMKSTKPLGFEKFARYVLISERYRRTLKLFVSKFFRKLKKVGKNSNFREGKSIFQTVLSSTKGLDETMEVLLRELHAGKFKFAAAVSFSKITKYTAFLMLRMGVLTVAVFFIWILYSQVDYKKERSAACESFERYIVYHIGFMKNVYTLKTGKDADVEKLFRAGYISEYYYREYIRFEKQ